MAFRRIDVLAEQGLLADDTVQLGNASEIDAPRDHRWQANLSGSFAGSGGQRHYYLGKYEVTQLQYRVLQEPCPERLAGRRPVVRISWYEAVDFTRRYTEWLYRTHRHALPEEDGVRGMLRLPTEVEWEYAARGGLEVDGPTFRQA